jgi:hypothetical protein
LEKAIDIGRRYTGGGGSSHCRFISGVLAHDNWGCNAGREGAGRVGIGLEAAIMGSSLKGKDMTKDLVLRGQEFDKLVIDLRKIIDAGRARAQAAANQALMRTYWLVGARIARERLTENSGYGESVMERLANELHADRTTLVRCVLYHQYYPKGVNQNVRLTWSHVRLCYAQHNRK